MCSFTVHPANSASPPSLASAISRCSEVVCCHWIPVGLNHLQGICKQQVPISCWFLWWKRTLVRLSALLSPSTEIDTAFATEKRWRADGRWASRERGGPKNLTVCLQMILFLYLGHQSHALPATLKSSKPAPGILLSALYINQVFWL